MIVKNYGDLLTTIIGLVAGGTQPTTNPPLPPPPPKPDYTPYYILGGVGLLGIGALVAFTPSKPRKRR